MLIHSLMFYLFAFVTVASAVMVITAKNPVHSVLFLILAFFNAAAIFLLQGAEFLAMILVIVYVGAVAVLFLFVVMMLDINFQTFQRGFVKYLPLGLAVAIILAIELIVALLGWQSGAIGLSVTETPALTEVSNTEAIGNIIYTHYIYLFQGAGMILLVAMLGAISLTLRSRIGVKRQRIASQVDRSTADEVTLVQVPTGSGVNTKPNKEA